MPEAYQRLLLDVMHGDASLFARADEVELAWGIIDPIQQGWEQPGLPPLALYEPGLWGPNVGRVDVPAKGTAGSTPARCWRIDGPPASPKPWGVSPRGSRVKMQGMVRLTVVALLIVVAGSAMLSPPKPVFGRGGRPHRPAGPISCS